MYASTVGGGAMTLVFKPATQTGKKGGMVSAVKIPAKSAKPSKKKNTEA